MHEAPHNSCYCLKPLVLAIAGFICMPLHAAQPADGNGPTVESIIVTGSYRDSLAEALDMKRNNVNFSDSILASDIADFPEQNLAEALQRIPGVAIERDKGMGTKVNVRSLGLEYTHTTINNISTSSGSGGRDVNFDVFASDLIQSVTVKKSPLASDEEGGVAGVVAIQTARPFDYGEDVYLGSAEGAYNSLSEQYDPRYSFLFSKNLNDRWGFLVSYAREDRTNRTDQADTAEFKTLGTILDDAYDITYDQAIETGLSEADATAAAEQARSIAVPAGVSLDALYPENVRDDIILNQQEKWGGTAAVQFRPNEDLLLSLDIMAGNFYGKEDDYLFGSWSGDATRARDLTIDANGVVTTGTFDNTQHEFKSYDRYRDEDYRQVSLKVDWALGDWDLDLLMGNSSADRSYQRTQAKWTAYAPITQTYATNGMVRTSEAFDLATDVSAYSFVFWDFDNTLVEDSKDVLQIDALRDYPFPAFPALASVQFGARYSDKSMDHNHGWTEVQGETVIQEEGGRQSTSTEWVGTPLPAEHLQSVNDVIPGPDYLSEVPGKFDAWMVIPNAWAREQYYVDGLEPNYFHNDFYQVDEDVLSFYAMADFDFDIGSMPAHLNIGARNVATGQTSYGYQNVDGVWSDEPVQFSTDYNDILPSINMTLDLNDDMLMRFAAAKVMSRASLSQLSGKRNISTNDRIIRMGNPDLEPLRATQFDLAYEWYFNEESLFAVTGFYKDLESFITEARTGTTDYQGEQFEVYSYINGEGSKIKGAEVILQLPMDFGYRPLQGFGINANYTWVDSSEGHVSDLGLKVPMYGLSEDAYNATFYYENYGVDLRFSYNYKGESVRSLEDNLYPIYRDGYGQWDMSGGYAINEHFKLTAQIINLTDEYITEYQVRPEYPKAIQVSGRRISVGVRAKF